MTGIPDWQIVGDWFDNCSCAGVGGLLPRR